MINCTPPPPLEMTGAGEEGAPTGERPRTGPGARHARAPLCRARLWEARQLTGGLRVPVILVVVTLFSPHFTQV